MESDVNILSGGGGKPSSFRSYESIFSEQCPYYMSMGMTYDEYWHGENDAIRMYRKTYELKRDRVNSELWLQGLYLYKVLTLVYPLYNPMVKPGTKLGEYLDRPLPITAEQMEQREDEARQRRVNEMIDALKSKAMKKGVAPDE